MDAETLQRALRHAETLRDPSPSTLTLNLNTPTARSVRSSFSSTPSAIQNFERNIEDEAPQERGTSAYRRRHDLMDAVQRGIQEYFASNDPNARNAIANDIGSNFPTLGNVLSNPQVMQAVQGGNRESITQTILSAVHSVGADTDTIMRFINPFLPAPVRAATGIIDNLANLANIYAEQFPRQSPIHKGLKTFSRNAKPITFGLVGATSLYGLSQGIGNIVSSVRNLLPWSATVIPPPPISDIGAGEIHSTIGEYLNDFIKVVNSADIYKNDSLAIQSIIGRTSGLDINTSQNELELNVLSLLKRRLIDTLQDTDPVSDFSTASMKNRSLQFAPVNPRNQGYPTRII